MWKIAINYDVGTSWFDNGTIKCEKKNNGTTECDKSIIIRDVGIAQCEDGIIKYEKKIREPSNVTKVQSHVMLILHNVRLVP